MNKILVIISLSLLNFYAGFSQVVDPGFAKYLTSKGYYEDVLMLDNLDQGILNSHQADSMNYYSGWASYNLQLLDRSISSFSLVSSESCFYNASRFLASWSEFYLGQIPKGMTILNQARPVSSAEKELFHMFKTSGTIMLRELPKADSLLNIVRNTNLIYTPQWERIEVHYNRLSDFKPKSYVLAGLLSGMLPGAGKVYTGQKGAGVSSFLIVGALAAAGLENGFKTGWKKWNTLMAASLFSVFYIGNIYGSVVGIKVYRNRFFDELDRAILLDINLPLRDLYR